MAASPTYKLYTTHNEYVAACKYLEDAAVLVAFLGDGATIRAGHRAVLWTEGAETQSASESYDHVLDVCLAREEQLPSY